MALALEANPHESFRQLAYVTWPDRFDDALWTWHDVMGVGPFYLAEFRLANQVFRGRPTDGTCKVALSYHGDVQVEIIAPTNDAPSPYTELLETLDSVPTAGAFHHVLVDAPDYDGTCERLLRSGLEESLSANLSDGRRMTYLDGRAIIGSYVEVIEAGTANTLLWSLMHRQCAEWGGTDPIRSYCDLQEQAESE